MSARLNAIAAPVGGLKLVILTALGVKETPVNIKMKQSGVFYLRNPNWGYLLTNRWTT